MGSFIIFCLILYSLYKDAQLLQAENPQLYDLRISLKPWLWTAISCLFFLVSLPVYYFLRQQFLKALAERRSQSGLVEYAHPKFLLITEVTEIALLWFFLVSCAEIIYMVFSFFSSASSSLFEFILLGLFSNIIMLILVVNAVRRNHRQTFFSFVCFCLPKGIWLGAILLSFGVGLVLAGSSYLLGRMYGILPPTPLSNALAAASSLSLFFFIFCAMFIAPFLEELIYRGYLFSIISEIKGNSFAIIFVTVIFGIFHIDQIWGSWFSLLFIFAMGFCVTLLRFWFHSVIPSMVVHYAYNIGLVVLPLIISYYASLGSLSATGQKNALSQSWERVRGFDSLQKGVLNKGYHSGIIASNGFGHNS